MKYFTFSFLGVFLIRISGYYGSGKLFVRPIVKGTEKRENVKKVAIMQNKRDSGFNVGADKGTL